MTNQTQILIADIGGTNSNFAILKKTLISFKIIENKKFKTNNYKTLSNIIQEYLENKNYKIDLAIFSIATDTSKKIKTLTNSKIKIDENQIKQENNLKQIIFLNDFEALAYYTLNYKKKDIISLQKSKIIKNKQTQNSLIIGAGTGLGISYLINNKKIIKNEDGHLHFTKQDEKINQKLFEFLKQKLNKNKLEYEDILSGKGLKNIYYFLTKKKKTANQISKLKNKDKTAKQTFDIFFQIYCLVIKNLIEKQNLNSVFIAGGIIEKNLDFNKKEFLDIISNKNIEINIIKNYDSSLEGLKNYTKINIKEFLYKEK